MYIMSTIEGVHIEYIMLGQCILTVILMILLIAALIQNRKLKRKYNRFMMGKNCETMENTILQMCRDVKDIKETHQAMQGQLDEMVHGIKSSYKKIGMVRYDAFKGMKGKLSFALCLLDDFNSGFVLNNMKGGDGNYTYMKEIIHGKSIVVLGEEEKQALEEALQCEKYE